MRGVRLLILAALAAPGLWAADVCPAGKGSLLKGSSETAAWTSQSAEIRPGKFCIANEIRNSTERSQEIVWPAAGIERAAVLGELRVEQCCFDRVQPEKGQLRVSGNLSEVTIYVAAEEGLENHKEGFPDLIEEDARVRTYSVRGVLFAGGKPVHIDVAFKCSASKFAKQNAYQYSISDHSPDPVDVRWDLIDKLNKRLSPSVQTNQSGKTYLFITDEAPVETEGQIDFHSRNGAAALVLRVGGYGINPVLR